jgi:hypothetical protein
MKKALILFILIYTKITCQVNLIQNPSFEDTLHCPTNVGEITAAKFWNNNAYTPDYYNPCATDIFSAPYNFAGYQNAASGQSYAGLITYTFDSPSSLYDYREYIGTYLLNPLNIGTKYYFSIKVCVASQPDITLNSSSNNIGVRFSVGNSGFNIHNNNADINFNTIVSDSVNWTKLTGSFIPDSSYNYITIGNFYNNINTQLINLNNDVDKSAYYYIDDICLSTDSIYAGTWTYTEEPERNINFLKIYPNPSNGEININLNNFKISRVAVYNIMGRVIKETKIENNIRLDLSSLNNGFYYVYFYSDDKIISVNKITINH